MSTTPPEDPYAPYEPGPGAPQQPPQPPQPPSAPPQGYGVPPQGYPTPYGAPQYAAPYPAVQQPGTDGFSIAALVTGLLGLGIVPLILGIVGLSRVRRTGQSGKGLAITGIVLGGLAMLAGIALVVGLVFLWSNEDVQNSVRDAWEQGTEQSAGQGAGQQSGARQAVGDCVPVDADLTETTAVAAVDCAGEHGGEVVGVKDMDDAEYPGIKATEDLAGRFCMDAFSQYVGIDFDESEIDLTFYYPSDTSWEQGDRQIACLAVTKDGSPLTGSVRGAAR